jgi:serine/threonine-protein kinase RsbW
MLAVSTPVRRNGNMLKRTLRNNWHLTHLSSTDEVVPLIETFAARMRNQCYSDDDIFGARLAFEEALVNAVKHGHRYDSSKRVAVRYRIRTERVLVEVRDQGPGFDLDRVPDPTAPENWERPSGRGLFLIRTYTSWLRYNRRGNCLRLCKYRTILPSPD